MSIPRFREIERIFRKEILESKYSEGNFPSVAALMRRFEISRATAVRVMDELKKQGLIRCVQGSGTFVTRKGASRKIAVLFPETSSSEYYTKIVKTISLLAQKKGYALLFAEIETEDSRTQVIEAERLARTICENDVVGVNNVVSGAKLYRHLYESGARRIHYLTIANSARSHLDRLRGLALEHETLTGRRWTEANVLIAHPGDRAAIRRHVRKGRPDAFVCGNDITAAWLMRTLGEIGLKVPEDILVTGFNDVSISWLSSPAITTVRQPTDVLGQIALQRLFARISDAKLPVEEILVDAPLVVRGSTMRKKRGKKN